MKKNKKRFLIAGILLDLIGMASFTVPVLGELSDLVWAPISGWIMSKMYKGKEGRIAAKIAMIEEILPFSDIIPTFTIMWIYTYVIKSEDKDEGRLIPIRIRSNR
ncbi:hypothetical protein SAMN05216480_11522 [Pustulibacterium marinum]|uniref:Uncharacterized protein n=1 Tax=Pustulibacterium marinum TaxID=1224947 RepID=A0A1I7ID44_9FLAO|nr:hypothetical protein [Pustulibacterium marinum]SFU70893.1 hypothetical protein SAMN05216480_11522 [Pustulibacterium marinum]